MKGRVTMNYEVKDSSCVYAMSKNNEPILKVPNGATVIFNTKDCFGNQITTSDTKVDALDWNHINPATGPVYVEGAEPGDILKVDIKKIEIEDHYTMVTGKDMGVYGDKLTGSETRVMPIKEGKVRFSDTIEIPIRPMIGVIGVAPEEEAISCGTPGEHGGNMDCKEIKEASTLLLPVNVPGALLSMGDLHGVMGDGEVSVCGAEVPGVVTVSIEVLKNSNLPTPAIINETHVMPIASEVLLEDAITKVVEKSVGFLTKFSKMEPGEAVTFLSLASDLKICQVVDPLKTVRMEIPLDILKIKSEQLF